MCSHYEAPDATRFEQAFGIPGPADAQLELWPGYTGPFVRLEEGETLASTGIFGLLPHWAKDATLARRTYNARSETAASKPSFRSAWREARHCIIPAVAIYEPDWRSGKPVPTRITRSDGGLLLVAGLWERWRDSSGESVHSFSMLTVNADEHPLMNQFHRPDKEKRMVVILPSGSAQDWLKASANESGDFLLQYPAERLCASH